MTTTPLTAEHPVSAFPALTVPSWATTPWVVETGPEEAGRWLAGLPQADAPQTGQQLYQALFTLNRMVLDVSDRLQLLELYRPAVAATLSMLRARLLGAALPLRPRFRQLADFLIQLQTEMAYGYKHVLRAAHERTTPRDSEAMLLAAARAIEALGRVLLNHYQVYQPTPSGVWREIHGLYRYVEAQDCQQRSLAAYNNNEVLTVMRAYLQEVMLGLCSPYQLQPGECHAVQAFLAKWVDRAVLTADIDGVDPLGHFLLDLSADHPAAPFPRDVSVRSQPGLRAINAVELARVVHGFVQRLQKMERVSDRELNFPCQGTSCLELLRRMLRFWGLAGRRQFSRRERRQALSVCVGLPALHFFLSGQQALPSANPDPGAAASVPSLAELDADAHKPASPATVAHGFRVDHHWQIRDESASGLLLTRTGDLGPAVRVGDLVGLLSPERERWRIGVARWVKSPDPQRVEMGVEMLAPVAQALALRAGAGGVIEPALLLPPVPALRRPTTLLAARTSLRPGGALDLLDAQGQARAMRVLSVTELSGSVAQAVVADAAR